LTGYEKYLQRKDSSKEQVYVRLNETGRKEYMKYVKKSYEMMLFWIGFGGVMGFLSYTFAPSVRFLRNLNSFKTIRMMLTILPLFVFPYHGIKFMIAYKRKGAREVGKDPNNILS